MKPSERINTLYNNLIALSCPEPQEGDEALAVAVRAIIKFLDEEWDKQPTQTGDKYETKPKN